MNFQGDLSIRIWGTNKKEVFSVQVMCPQLLPTDTNFTSSEVIVCDFPNKMSEKICLLKAETQPE